MPELDTMTINDRRKYLKRMYPRYRDAPTRQRKSALLTEMEAVTGLHRKHLIRLLTPDGLARTPRQRQRGVTYDHQVDDALRIIAETLDYICAERLTPALLSTAADLARHGEMLLTDAVRQQLAVISVSTVQRHLARLRQDEPRLPRARPTRSAVAASIPMRRIAWDETTPGHFEVDLVHHCGPSASGDYLHTLQMIDVATTFSERTPVFGRSQRAMHAAFERIEARLPFPILEVHPDNGPEFLNAHLVSHFRDRVHPIDLSRSRPYHKNDNRFVEAKNFTLVRAYFGDARFDTLAHYRLLDQLYDHMWLYYNAFQPVLRLTEKDRLSSEGHSAVRRKWDEARTPLERLCATDALVEPWRSTLLARRHATNPRQLRAEMYRLRDALFDLPLARQPQDVMRLLEEEAQGSHKGDDAPTSASPMGAIR